MFSLIITIISIALVTALALATVYYGGEAYTDSTQPASVTRILNQASQVEAATRIFETEQRRPPAALQELVDLNYLSVLPGETEESSTNTFQLGTGYVLATVGTSTMCEDINARLGLPRTVPQCDDPAIAGLKSCCATGS